MAPRTAQPFDAAPIIGIATGVLQGVEHIVQTHRPHPVKKGAGIFQHHSRLLALVDQLRDKFANPLVAPVKGRRVVVIADVLVIPHIFQIADDRRRGQIAATGGNQRLVHVQGNGAGGANMAEINPAFWQIRGLGATGAHRLFHERLRTADIRQTINILWKLAHA